MPLADGGIIALWVVLILAVGFVGFFVVLLVMLGRMLRFALRALWPFGHNDRPDDGRPPSPAARACPNPRCGHTNPPEARYCARCGGSLGNVNDVDRYG